MTASEFGVGDLCSESFPSSFKGKKRCFLVLKCSFKYVSSRAQEDIVYLNLHFAGNCNGREVEFKCLISMQILERVASWLTQF